MIDWNGPKYENAAEIQKIFPSQGKIKNLSCCIQTSVDHLKLGSIIVVSKQQSGTAFGTLTKVLVVLGLVKHFADLIDVHIEGWSYSALLREEEILQLIMIDSLNWRNQSSSISQDRSLPVEVNHILVALDLHGKKIGASHLATTTGDDVTSQILAYTKGSAIF
ncbi:MAG: hypothetical protein JSC189_000184 [Candidatus Tokpelaia sp. JSC189]|nr:MAG: hypothetical protein JSC189_000184 [Candidatus Tokpelaia sp. JSC189]